MWERAILSAIVFIITNLIVGSISISLGMLALFVTLGIAALLLLSLAALGLSIALEKIGWLPRGWTDLKLDALREWLRAKRRNMPRWYHRMKRGMIQMLIEMLQEKQQEADAGGAWKSIGIGLLALLSVVLLVHTFQTRVATALIITALGSVLVAIPVLYFTRKKVNNGIKTQTTGAAIISGASADQAAEVTDAINLLLDLHRSGVLLRLKTAAAEAPGSKVMEKSGDADAPK